MKKFMIFAGHYEDYIGGFYQFFNDFDTIQECKDWIEKIKMTDNNDWYHIVDIEKREFVSDIQK